MDRIVLWYALGINVVTLLLFGIDKWKASSQRWRIPEAQLLLASAAGGSPGGWLAMTMFRHKTQKTSFRVKMVVATLVNGLWVWWFWRS